MSRRLVELFLFCAKLMQNDTFFGEFFQCRQFFMVSKLHIYIYFVGVTLKGVSHNVVFILKGSDKAYLTVFTFEVKVCRSRSMIYRFIVW